MKTPLWSPSEAYIQNSALKKFEQFVADKRGTQFASYQALWEWSVNRPAEFWEDLAAHFNVTFHTPPTEVLTPAPDGGMIGTKWFAGATLNYAEEVFKHDTNDRPALVYRSENQEYTEISWSELRRKVWAIQQFLLKSGIEPGDRVGGYLTNSPEAIYIFLAVNSIGAVWSCCSPDFGTDSVVERFQQIEPKLLFTVGKYSYNGKQFNKKEVIAALEEKLPSVHDIVIVDTLRWKSILATFNEYKPLVFNPVAFDHPIWILYSSGTTGKPKAITHSTGGNLLEHLKALALHQNVQPGERFFWYTTTGWMMWNYAVSSLLCGATLCLYDGAPNYPDNDVLWQFAKQAGVQHFGSGAAFYIASKQAALPLKNLELTLKTLGSTGSPLPPDVFEWLYGQFPDVHLISLSGGTDVCSAFVSGCAYLPVYAGEIQCRAMGAAIAAYNENGEAVTEEVGELVIEQPMPSMPIYFWNDENNARYRDSYFTQNPNVWYHGDWIKLTDTQGVIIYGRSDATLNRGGVRIGTAEVYNALADIPEIADSLVVCIDKEDGSADMPLFVVMKAGNELTDDVKTRIKSELRTQYSPRHVPDSITAVPAIPYTISGKKMELPVKKLLMGVPPEKAVSLDAMRNPEAIQFWVKQ